MFTNNLIIEINQTFLFVNTIAVGLPLQNELPEVKYVPDTPPNHQVYPNMSRRLLECRGVEIVHNKLIHKQYGIMVCYWNSSLFYFILKFRRSVLV
jgi:hypothetical protein